LPPRDAAEIHLWGLRTDSPPPQAIEALLTDDERARAGRFRFEHDRARFVLTRGILRLLLGHYLGQPPASLAIRYSPAGKPSLANEPAARCFGFNVSHSHGLALLAFGETLELGVDVEFCGRNLDFHVLAERFFAGEEVSALKGLPPAEQRDAFFRCWTRKESFIKAIGQGVGFGLDRFAVTLDSDSPRLLYVRGDAPVATGWTLHHLEPAAHYVGALAYPGTARAVRRFVWGNEVLG